MINKAKLEPQKFQKTVDGQPVNLYTLTNKKGTEVHVTNLGAKLVSIMVQGKTGWTDVLIGHDSIDEFINSEEAYFGAICGRYANRIACGKFSIDGNSYQLPINNGPNSLHGGIKGFNAVVWAVQENTTNKLKLSYLSKDGEDGYPGNLNVMVTYLLTDDDELSIEYEATTDKATVLNLTNHAYFNLSGNGDQSIHDHLLMIKANEYLPTDETAIPYGEPATVHDTPMDFRCPTAIGLRVDNPTDQLKWARGYDHTYILDKPLGKLGLAASAKSPKTGIVMDVYTDQPGVQLYTGNWMSGNMRGKHDARYPARAAFCLETQHYPDSPNKPEYPTTRLNPGETFNSTTVFAFRCE